MVSQQGNTSAHAFSPRQQRFPPTRFHVSHACTRTQSDHLPVTFLHSGCSRRERYFLSAASPPKNDDDDGIPQKSVSNTITSSNQADLLSMENLYQEWTIEQDQLLWENRHESTIALASRLGRGLRGVETRLAKLRDVNSKAYERLFSDQEYVASFSANHNSEDSNTAAKTKLVPASEVLRRIQWDPSLSPHDFVVMHYDRVQDEIIESPFDAPNTSIAGAATSLIDALPEHRIVGIKYKERVVWHRERRFDLIFSGPGIENIMTGYEQWKQRRTSVQEFNRQRQFEVSERMQQILGLDHFELFKAFSRELQVASQDPGQGASLTMQVETYVRKILELFRRVRNDPSGSVNPSLIPMSDYNALDQLSELVALLPDSNLRPLILKEIARSMQRTQGKKFSSPATIQELPELDEDDLTETFVRGSGSGGQKINKTSNCVVLVHNPTGIRVECQETRSLQQNRKIARKRLRLKLDDYLNGSQSRNSIKAQKAASKKNRTKAKNRTRQRKKQEASNQISDQ